MLIDSATDQPRVTDFGLAKRLESETELTLSGQLLGSPNYMSPDGQILAVGLTNGTIMFSNAKTGAVMATNAHASIKFWDTAIWKEIPPSLGHKEYVTGLAFSPDGRTLASTSADGTMKFWNVATRRELASLKLSLGDIAFSPDGQTLAASDGGSLRLWRAPRTNRK